MSTKIKIIIIVIILGLLGVNFFVLKKDEPSAAKKPAEVVTEVPAEPVTAVVDKEAAVAETTETVASGEALIGGSFSLTDQNGAPFTEQSLKGKYSLVYFGFTHCPMICPTALSNISLAFSQLDPMVLPDFQAIFITTDPERDTQARLKEVLSNYATPITGLTGSPDELAKVKQAYKVYAEKLEVSKDGNYDMDHTSIIYVMDKEGKYVTHFTHQSKVEDMVAKLKTLN